MNNKDEGYLWKLLNAKVYINRLILQIKETEIINNITKKHYILNMLNVR